MQTICQGSCSKPEVLLDFVRTELQLIADSRGEVEERVMNVKHVINAANDVCTLRGVFELIYEESVRAPMNGSILAQLFFALAARQKDLDPNEEFMPVCSVGSTPWGRVKRNTFLTKLAYLCSGQPQPKDNRPKTSSFCVIQMNLERLADLTLRTSVRERIKEIVIAAISHIDSVQELIQCIEITLSYNRSLDDQAIHPVVQALEAKAYELDPDLRFTLM